MKFKIGDKICRFSDSERDLKFRRVTNILYDTEQYEVDNALHLSIDYLDNEYDILDEMIESNPELFL